jgi:EcsC protein family
MSRILSGSAQAGFLRAYRRIRIDERKYLRHLQRAHRLPIDSFQDVFRLSPGVLNPIAYETISASAKFAALEGAGLGLGGLLTAVPDMGILAAITLRLLQKLSLLYGFEYATQEEAVELWIAAASAAGVDLGRDFLEKQAMDKIVPRVIDQMAMKVGADVAEKWVGRVVPVLSAGAAGAINYYFVRSWGRRGQKHFLARHNAVAGRGGTITGYPATRALLPSVSS